MAEFDYIENTWDFRYKVGDYLDSQFSVPVDGEMYIPGPENYCMLSVNEIDKEGDIKKVCIVRGPEGVVEVDAFGYAKCPIVEIFGYGYIDVATFNGVQRIKTLIPVHDRYRVQFVMGKIVARPI